MTEENQNTEVEEELEPEPPRSQQYYADFDESGNIIGFYFNKIHGDNIPETAIPISEEEWRTYIEDSNKYKLDGDTIREKTEDELKAEGEAKPKPPPSRIEVLETENADLWYELMLEKNRNDTHDRDIAEIWYEMMIGGISS